MNTGKRSLYNKRHWLNNKEYFKGYCLKNKEKITKQKKENYLKNIETRLKQSKNYRLNNKNYYKEWILKNREKSRLYGNNYINIRRKTDEGFSLLRRLRVSVWSALKNYSATGKIKKADKYGIDYKKIIEHLGLCPGNREDYEIDHIVPLSYFDFNDSVQVRAAFAPKNHQWLTKKENLKKGNKIACGYCKKYTLNLKKFVAFVFSEQKVFDEAMELLEEIKRKGFVRIDAYMKSLK